MMLPMEYAFEIEDIKDTKDPKDIAEKKLITTKLVVFT